MRRVVSFLLVVLAVSCHGTTTDRDDIAASKDSSLATFLQPLEARLRDDQSVPERRSRELSYLGYSYHPYGAHHNPLYSSGPYSQQGLYNPYSNLAPYSFGGLNGGYGGGVAGLAAGYGGIAGSNGAFLGTGGVGGYPTAGVQQFGYTGFGQGSGSYPYAGGWNAVGQSPYAGYGSQLGGYYNRGLYV
uniref:Uncharacterized protein n=1 Tax=Anopheles christyi TaxID=43041 RepID=A0A182K0Y6_9DIPT